jgi:hypothetical protein
MSALSVRSTSHSRSQRMPWVFRRGPSTFRASLSGYLPWGLSGTILRCLCILYSCFYFYFTHARCVCILYSCFYCYFTHARCVCILYSCIYCYLLMRGVCAYFTHAFTAALLVRGVCAYYTHAFTAALLMLYSLRGYWRCVVCGTKRRVRGMAWYTVC